MAQRATDTPQDSPGRRMAGFRKWLGLSQPELAEWIGGEINRSNISACERGERPVPAQRLISTFGLSYDWLMGWDDEWWGPQVQGIRAHLDRWLSSMSASDNDSLLHAGERIAASYNEITRVSPLVNERYAAAILGVGEQQFTEILAEETFATDAQWERWASFTGLPVAWLASGELPNPAELTPAMTAYLQPIRVAMKLGIHPDRLERLIRALAE